MTEVVETQDVDKLEMLINGLDRIVKAGEKVYEDGKVDWKDAIHAPELIEGSKAYERFKIFRKEFNNWKRAQNQEEYYERNS